MPARNPTFIDEAISAVRGTAAVAVGSRDTPLYFDFSRRGLIGSFIALLLGIAVGLVMQGGAERSTVAPVLLVLALLYVVQMATVYLVLMQMQRLDGFVPYVVVENWLQLVLGIVFGVVSMAGVSGESWLLIAGMIALWMRINIARQVVTLRPLQVLVFLVAQIVTVSVAGLVIFGSSGPPA